MFTDFASGTERFISPSPGELLSLLVQRRVTKETHPGQFAPAGFLRITHFAYVPAPFGIHASSRLNSPSRRICTVKAAAAQQTEWG
jgi:hypothetical protein